MTTGMCEKTLKILSFEVTKLSGVAVTKDGAKIVSGSKDKTVRLWNMTTGICDKAFKRNSQIVTSVAVTKDGAKIISGSEDNSIRIWEYKAFVGFTPSDALDNECRAY